MGNKDFQNLENEHSSNEVETEILRDDELNPNDSTVVIEEEDRTVLLKEDETLILEKDETIDIPPKNRQRKVYGGMWGMTEITLVGMSSFAVLLVVLFYLFSVLPEQNELETTRANRDSVEKELVAARTKYGDITDTKTQVSKLLDSAEDFETRYLKDEALGKSAIYQRLNGLIAGLGLTNTTGPDYVPIETSEEERRSGTNSDGQQGRSKFQSLFPGIYVTMTVEGSYFALRRFIQEIEKSQEFIIISTIELEPAEDNDAEKETGVAVRKVAKIGKTRGKVVSLRLEMAAYFQRSASQRAMTNSTVLGETEESGEDEE